jgi:asparagine synthase (glutamine-hydrolysing)
MSGIVGIVNFDGAPVDRDLVTRMTESMRFRGPDAKQILSHTHAGFGHTMLRTTREAENEKQPLTFDGKVWLTADARIDGRADLAQKLGVSESTHNDAELILLAYHAGCSAPATISASNRSTMPASTTVSYSATR